MGEFGIICFAYRLIRWPRLLYASDTDADTNGNAHGYAHGIRDPLYHAVSITYPDGPRDALCTWYTSTDTRADYIPDYTDPDSLLYHAQPDTYSGSAGNFVFTEEPGRMRADGVTGIRGRDILLYRRYLLF